MKYRRGFVNIQSDSDNGVKMDNSFNSHVGRI